MQNPNEGRSRSVGVKFHRKTQKKGGGAKEKEIKKRKNEQQLLHGFEECSSLSCSWPGMCFRVQRAVWSFWCMPVSHCCCPSKLLGKQSGHHLQSWHMNRSTGKQTNRPTCGHCYQPEKTLLIFWQPTHINSISHVTEFILIFLFKCWVLQRVTQRILPIWGNYLSQAKYLWLQNPLLEKGRPTPFSKGGVECCNPSMTFICILPLSLAPRPHWVGGIRLLPFHSILAHPHIQSKADICTWQFFPIRKTMHQLWRTCHSQVLLSVGIHRPIQLQMYSHVWLKRGKPQSNSLVVSQAGLEGPTTTTRKHKRPSWPEYLKSGSLTYCLHNDWVLIVLSNHLQEHTELSPRQDGQDTLENNLRRFPSKLCQHFDSSVNYITNARYHHRLVFIH